MKIKEQFIAKTWIVGGAYVINIPKKLVRLFNIKKGKNYRITIESIN
jgi:hypothetical protein